MPLGTILHPHAKVHPARPQLQHTYIQQMFWYILQKDQNSKQALSSIPCPQQGLNGLLEYMKYKPLKNHAQKNISLFSYRIKMSKEKLPKFCPEFQLLLMSASLFTFSISLGKNNSITRPKLLTLCTVLKCWHVGLRVQSCTPLSNGTAPLRQPGAAAHDFWQASGSYTLANWYALITDLS